MAWTVRTPSSGKDSSAGTSHSIVLPATVEAGDLLIAFFTVDGNPVVTWDDSTAGTWTELNFSPYVDSTAVETVAYWKSAAGTEDGATLSVTTDASEAGTYVVFAIAGWHGTTAPEGTGIRATGTTIDPTTHTASWGTESNLWLAIAGSDGQAQIDNSGGEGYPAGYSNTGTTDNGLAGSTNTAWGTLESAADSENPDLFTFGASSVKQAFTVAVRPASGTSVAPLAMVNFARMHNG